MVNVKVHTVNVSINAQGFVKEIAGIKMIRVILVVFEKVVAALSVMINVNLDSMLV